MGDRFMGCFMNAAELWYSLPFPGFSLNFSVFDRFRQATVKSYLKSNIAIIFMKTQETISQIRHKLWRISKEPLLSLYNNILQLIPLQTPETFIALMRECLQASKQDPNLVQYLSLFGMLLNDQVFNQLLQGCLVEFYSKIVSQLYKMKRGEEIERAKIMRKCWVWKIHPGLYEDLKSQTYRLASVDVDLLLSVQAIQYVRHYYLQVLRMPHREMLYHLPQLTTTHSPHPAYQPPNYAVIDSYPINKLASSHKFRESSHSYSNDGQNYYKAFPISKNMQQPKPYINSIDHSNPKANNDSVCLSTIPIQNNLDSLKRVRYQSEETNADDNEEQIRKIRHLDYYNAPTYLQSVKNAQPNQNRAKCPPRDSIVTTMPTQICSQQKVEIQRKKGSLIGRQGLEALKFLQKLANLNEFQCKQCGIRFQSHQGRKEHTMNHMMYKLQTFDIKQAKKFKSNIYSKSCFISPKEWLVCVSEEGGCSLPMDKKQADPLGNSCRFCGNMIDYKLESDKWIYQNAVKTVMISPGQSQKQAYDSQCLMHKSCADALMNSEGVESKVVYLGN